MKTSLMVDTIVKKMLMRGLSLVIDVTTQEGLGSFRNNKLIIIILPPYHTFAESEQSKVRFSLTLTPSGRAVR